jgi:hypothetical protein
VTRVDSLGGKGAADLLADLAEARRAERVAISLLAEVREELAATVINAKAKRVGYDRMAQVALRAVHGQTVTLADREREAARLRKLVQRRRRDTCHDIGSRRFENAPPTQTRSEDKEIPMEKLSKRATIEETFSTDGTDERQAPADLDDRDDLEGEDDADEDDAAARKARRR